MKRDLAVGLALYVSLVVIVDGFYNTGIYLPGLEKGSIRYSELCIAFLFFARPGPTIRNAPYRIVSFLVGLYFLLMLLSMFRSDSLVSGIFEFRRVMIPQIVAFLVASRLLKTPEEFKRFFMCLIVLVLVVGVFDFWDIFFDRWVLHSDILFDPMYWSTRKHGRFGSIFLNPNFLGAFVVLVFPVLFTYSLDMRGRLAKTYCWVGLMALAFCLIETQSRGPLLAFAVALIVLMLGPFKGWSRARRIGMLTLFVGGLALFMPNFFQHSVQRFSDIEVETSSDTASRQTNWDYTKRLIADNPVLGIGFGESQFISAMRATDFAERYGRESYDNPHNSYLQAAVYAGLPALMALLLANLIVVLRAIKISSSGDDGKVRQVIFGLTVGIAGFLVSIFPDMHLFTWTVAPVYWVFFALLLSLISDPQFAGGRFAATARLRKT